MGIRNLNRFIKDNASSGINIISFDKLRGKTVAVDISVYIYQFLSDNCLIENMYLMLAIFKKYNIIPIFIFDGKSPLEKSDLLQKKKEDKKTAEEECNKLQEKLENATNNRMNNSDIIQHKLLLKNIETMKKKCIYMTKNVIEIIKKLIISFGYSYYNAPNEADEICALLCLQGKVWGCISEDTDMFVYGCPNIIRYFNPLNQTAHYYQLDNILTALNIPLKVLREICVLSGTDYNINDTVNMNISELYFNYIKTQDLNKYYITEKQEEEYKKINNMFTLKQCNEYENILADIQITNNKINYDDIKGILKTDGFLF